MDNTVRTESYPKQRTNVLTELLVVVIICTFVSWYLQFLWRRRKLYLSSIQLPGPLALPIIGSAFSFIGSSTDVLNQVNHFFKIYPGIFRIWFGTRMFYGVSDPKYIEILLSSSHALGKEYLYLMAAKITGVGLFTAPVKRWRKTRKIIHPAFNQKILDNFVNIFVQQSKVFVEVMQDKYIGKGEFDMFTPMTRCTLDIISETAMGVQIKAQTTDSEVPHWVDRFMEIVLMRIFNIFYHIDFIFDCSPLGREFHILAYKFKSLTMKVVTEKRIQYEQKMQNQEHNYVDTDSTKIKPFLDLLIEMNHNMKHENRFSDDELLDETVTFMIAGSDTTATSICNVLTMLGMHQDIQEKALAEILEVIESDRDVHFTDLPRLKYLERIIKETLRIFPVGAFIAREINENIDLGDCIVQKGNSVVIGILHVHRDEKYWPNPLKFDPDRFLPEEVAIRPPGCYIPFSYGPRNCIGMKYAMMSMKSVLATILRKYKIHTSYKRVEDIELKVNLVLRPTKGFKISLELRE